MERGEGRELVRIEAVVERSYQRVAPDRMNGLVVDLDYLVGQLKPRRSARPEEIGHEGQEAHQKQGSHEAPVVLAIGDPENEPDYDRQDEMHEIENHRGDVLYTHYACVVEGVLKYQRRNSPCEEP